MSDINFETLRDKIIDFSNYEPDPEYKRRLEEYHKKIEDDFQVEWSKKKFKWFFKKRRQQKLRARSFHRYAAPIFCLIEDTIENILSKRLESSEFFDEFVDVKDLALGDQNYFIDESTVDKFNSYGCTSFNLTDAIKRHNTPNLEPSHPCYGCCHHEGCGYFDFYDNDKTEEENTMEHCAGCCCGDGWECNKQNDYGCSNYEMEPILG